MNFVNFMDMATLDYMWKIQNGRYLENEKKIDGKSSWHNWVLMILYQMGIVNWQKRCRYSFVQRVWTDGRTTDGRLGDHIGSPCEPKSTNHHTIIPLKKTENTNLNNASILYNSNMIQNLSTVWRAKRAWKKFRPIIFVKQQFLLHTDLVS